MIRQIFTLNHADIYHLEKPLTRPFHAPKSETRRDRFQLAQTPSRKSPKIVIPTTRNRLLARNLAHVEALIPRQFR
jgi:hypothetical protein